MHSKLINFYLTSLQLHIMLSAVWPLPVLHHCEPGRVAQSVGHLTRKSEVLGLSGHILSFLLPLIQEGQLSVTGESRMCTKYWLTAYEV